MFCTLGKYEERNTGAHSCEGEITLREHLNPTDIRLIRLRSECKKHIKSVCARHYRKFVETYSSHVVTCCNPFQHHKERAKKRPKARNLKEITLKMRDDGKEKDLNLIPGQKLCVSCSVHFASLFPKKKNVPPPAEPPPIVSPKEPQTALSSASVPSSSLPPSQQACTSGCQDEPGVNLSRQGSDAQAKVDQKDASYLESLDSLNEWLSSVGKNPVSLRKLSASHTYLEKVLDDIRDVLQKCSGKELSDTVAETSMKAQLYEEMVLQLKKYFIRNKSDKKAQMLALSVLPKSLSVAKVIEQFDTSSHRVRKVKATVEEKGILSLPEVQQGRKLPEETITKVRDFFYRMDVSRELPGKKDTISVIENKRRVLKRKRLVLGTLSQLHKDFLKENTDLKISASKFASLRPKECVLAGSPGTHVVCVCTYHQNPKLMFRAAGLHNIDGLSSEVDCLKYFLCDNPTESCHLRSCEDCPDGLQLQEMIELYFAEEMIEDIKYNQWKSTDRSEMASITCSGEEFIDDFFKQLQLLVTHDFIAHQQSSFYREKMKNLEEGEVIINADFAENYTYVIQESAQSHYFSNKQATIHPFMCYGKKDGDIVKLPFVIISDYTEKHDTAAFSSFQVKLMNFLTLNLGSLKKNRKSVANTWFHFSDFGVSAEWHFFATSHGKCACDGLGGTVKRVAYLHSLRATNPGEQITNAIELFNFSVQKIKSMTFELVTSDDVKNHIKKMEVRFSTAAEIDGIKSSHAIIPSPNNYTVFVKPYSNSPNGNVRKISATELQIQFKDVRGFIIYARSNEQWNLGYVEDTDEEVEEITVNPLKAETPLSFEFQDNTVHELISCSEVLLLVQPRVFKKGQVYKLLAKDLKAANETFKVWKSKLHVI
ncbi:ARL14 effector protein [Frankliniella fusca]|uniref:ARL14 effector protein n=1 Tax=Frankliniella fusca TaxID=407009 RepID=A0AAE1H4F1_9NEOP|nr:ARL14 effector protein [Frankliniella fusca]